ncbi:hypothetical protein PUN4_230096 [Paraburkholderia unamae]|nr:hypothetical protein PUN4_230096 [Paraburkholderia unamae]
MGTPTDRAAVLRRVWCAPVTLASLTIVGLLSALVGNGILNDVAWIFLATPVLVAGCFGVIRAER